ncbi:hypothetical protein [Streptomyces sp. NPDC088348]
MLPSSGPHPALIPILCLFAALLDHTSIEAITAGLGFYIQIASLMNPRS